MLILFVRVIFVIFATFFGYQSGQFFYEGHNTPFWVGGILGFTVAVTLIAAEHAWRRYFNRTLIAFLFGLSLGLLISYLLILIIREVVNDADVSQHLAIPISLVITYLVLLSVLRNADRLRLILPFVELRNDHIESGAMVVDASALADSRLMSLLENSIINQRIIIHSCVLIAAESLIHNNDDNKRVLARKALDAVKTLQDKFGNRITIDHTSIPNANGDGETLVGLARLENATLCSNDSSIISTAKQQGLQCLVINELAQLLLPSIRPGETISVRIAKKGDGDNQGIGYLDDGSMVIVNNAAAAIDKDISCTILRLHQTNNGRMIFAEHQ